jgi:two-component system, cell cycle sensor histidine kinase and response regulator CckA
MAKTEAPGPLSLPLGGRLRGPPPNLFDYLPLAIVVTNSQGDIADANAAALDLLRLDCPAGSCANTPFPFPAFVRADASPLPRAEHPSELAAREGRTIVEETIGLRRSDDEITWFHATATPVAGVGVITSYYDVTRARQIEDDLRHHLDQLDAFFDTNLDLLAILNSDGQAVRLNPAWGRLFGYDADELDGARPFDFVHPSDIEATLGAVARLRTPNEVVGFVNRMRHHDGSYRILEWRATARDALIYITARDITDQRMAETALRESEMRYRAIFEQAAVGVAEVETGTGRFLRVNRRLCEIVGYSEEELLARDFQSLTHPEDLPTDLLNLRAVSEGKLAEFNREKRYIRKDGRTVWVNLQVKALGEFGTHSYRNVTVVEDITERRETDELLRKSLSDVLEANQRLNFQVTRMPLGYIAWSLDFHVTEWNPAAERIFGWTAREAIGRHCFDFLVPPEVRPEVAKVFLSVVDGGDYASRSINDNWTRDGRRITCEWFAAPQIDAAGKIVGCLSMVHDISEHRRAEEKVLHSQHMESLGSFAGGIAHDISNVIRSIMAVASSMQLTPPDEATLAKGMMTILQACGRGRTLVRGLLDFARQDLSESKVLDLNAIIEEQIKLLGRSMPAKVRVARELDPMLGPITGDALALASAIMHLILNAIDAMPNGGLLTLRSRMQGLDEIELDVEDTGLGMSKDVLDRAMDPFFTTKPRGKNSGLGLPAVYGAVKAHQGHIELHSEEGRGTQVHIVLPARPDIKAQPGRSIELAPQPKGLGILLVDDDDLVLSAVSAQLRRLGHLVTTAENGQEALDKLQAGLQADLVLLDINMPVLDGFQALPRLRALRPDLPVIIETGNMGDRAEDLASAHRDVSVLVRPFSLSELKAALDPWVERARAAETLK